MLIFSESKARSANELFDGLLSKGQRWVRHVESRYPKGMGRGRYLQPEAVVPILMREWEKRVASARALSATRTESEWLWLLRCLDSIFIVSRWPSEAAEILAKAEYLSALAPRDPKHAVSPVVNADSALDVLKFVILARSISELEHAMRRAGKGQRLAAIPGGWSQGTSDQDLRVENGIFLFDRRNEDGRSTYWNVALIEEWLPTSEHTPGFVIARRFNTGWHPVSQWIGGMPPSRTHTAPGQFQALKLKLREKSWHADFGRWINLAENPNRAAAALQVSAMLDEHLMSDTRAAGVELARAGYVQVNESQFRVLMDRVRQRCETAALPIPPSLLSDTSNGLWQLLRTDDGSGNRHHFAPALRKARDGWVIDALSLAEAIHYELVLARAPAGLTQTAAATSFEKQVQAMIDGEGSGLTSPLRELRGRKLRLNHSEITDIDALFVRGSTLFLVSCKNYVRNRDYDASDYRTVRNVTTSLDQAVAEWQDRIKTLRNSRMGDNYNFSDFDEIDGIVVTPQVLFASGSGTLELVWLIDERAVHRACSFDELRIALGAAPQLRADQSGINRYVYSGRTNRQRRRSRGDRQARGVRSNFEARREYFLVSDGPREGQLRSGLHLAMAIDCLVTEVPRIPRDPRQFSPEP